MFKSDFNATGSIPKARYSNTLGLINGGLQQSLFRINCGLIDY